MAEIKGVNKKAMQKWPGKRFRLRPPPKQHPDWQPGTDFHLAGWRERGDDLWFVERINDDEQTVVLQNSAIPYGCVVPFDSIKEFRQDTMKGSDGFLMLKAQLHIFGYEVRLEPF